MQQHRRCKARQMQRQNRNQGGQGGKGAREQAILEQNTTKIVHPCFSNFQFGSPWDNLPGAKTSFDGLRCGLGDVLSPLTLDEEMREVGHEQLEDPDRVDYIGSRFWILHEDTCLSAHEQPFVFWSFLISSPVHNVLLISRVCQRLDLGQTMRLLLRLESLVLAAAV